MIFPVLYSPTNWRFCDQSQRYALQHWITEFSHWQLRCSPSYVNPRSEAEIGKSSEARVQTPSRQYSKPIATPNVKNDRRIESRLNPTQPNPTRGWKRLNPSPSEPSAETRRADTDQLTTSRMGSAAAHCPTRQSYDRRQRREHEEGPADSLWTDRRGARPCGPQERIPRRWGGGPARGRRRRIWEAGGEWEVKMQAGLSANVCRTTCIICEH